MDKEKSIEEKNKGNEAIEKMDYKKALQHYNNAIHYDPSNHILYSNRSMTHLKLKDYQNSLQDANKTIELNPQFAKGYSRKAAALFCMERYEESHEAYSKALEIEPNNELYKKESANLLSKELKKQIMDKKLSIPILHSLIEKKADLNYREDYSNFYFSLCNDNCDESVIREMVNLKADLNLQSERERSSPFHKLCCQDEKNLSLMKLFLENNANPNLGNLYTLTPFFYFSGPSSPSAKTRPTLEGMKLMISHKADINLQVMGASPLLNTFLFCGEGKSSSEMEQMKIFEYLLLNANIAKDTTLGQIGHLMHKAALNHSLEMMKMIYEYHNKDVNVVNEQGQTPLHLIWLRYNSGSLEKCKFLLDKNADINKKDKQGNTPINQKLQDTYFDVELLELFLNYGADLNIKNNEGKSAVDQLNKHPKILERYQELQKGKDNVQVILNNNDPPNKDQPKESTKEKKCASCGTTKDLKKCGACKSIKFCSVACQKKIWPSHKLECKKLQEQNK